MILPRTRLGNRLLPGHGSAVSSKLTTSLPASLETALGPTLKLWAFRRSPDLPRSVIAQRFPWTEYSATLIATWFSGSRLPAQWYQGEKTEPTKAITTTANRPQSLMPSMYHQR
jgi:hypothetical protein